MTKETKRERTNRIGKGYRKLAIQVCGVIAGDFSTERNKRERWWTQQEETDTNRHDSYAPDSIQLVNVRLYRTYHLNSCLPLAWLLHRRVQSSIGGRIELLPVQNLINSPERGQNRRRWARLGWASWYSGNQV